jgi:hypothetical protein
MAKVQFIFDLMQSGGNYLVDEMDQQEAQP